MAIFIAELQGEAVSVFNASDAADAQEYTTEGNFQDDLLSLEHGGKSVWDGVSPLHIRDALPGEEKLWQQAWTDAERSGEVEEGDTVCVWFFYPRDGRNGSPRANGCGPA